jgi:uncharacterized membrane protein (DUF106 family)
MALGSGRGMYLSFLDPVFDPILKLDPLIAIIILSIALSLLITLIYKWMTNQKELKEMKDNMKGMQKKMKELKNDPPKMMAKQKEMMQINMKVMMSSMKPTLVTFIPIIVIFGWLAMNFAYNPILPGTEFTTTITFHEPIVGNITINPNELSLLEDSNTKRVESGEVSFKLTGKDPGTYYVDYTYGEEQYSKEILITEGTKYVEPIKLIEKSDIKSISTNNGKKIVLDLFGWKLGWLGTYIIFSLIFSLVLRKLLKVY